MAVVNVHEMNSSMLVDHLILCATERGILIADGAEDDELQNAQRKVDIAHQELQRRISW
jgi:translation initiation factor 6 (eIF-6)